MWGTFFMWYVYNDIQGRNYISLQTVMCSVISFTTGDMYPQEVNSEASVV